MSVTARDDFGADDYARALARSNGTNRPLSLHLRLPLGTGVTPVTRHAGGMAPFEVDLARLDREMMLVRRCLAAGRRTQALQWEGCPPSGMGLAQMSGLIDRLGARFALATGRDRDFVVELDPWTSNVFALRHLEALGFNRLGLVVRPLTGVGTQTLSCLQARVEPLLDEAIRLSWQSLSLVLVVTAPLRGHEVSATLTALIAMAPPRISLRPDARLVATERGKLRDLAETRLSAAGYRAIGHATHARRGDALEDALAQLHHEARRDRLGLGVGGASRLPDAEARNTASFSAYAAALEAGRLATASGRWRRGGDAATPA